MSSALENIMDNVRILMRTLVDYYLLIIYYLLGNTYESISQSPICFLIRQSTLRNPHVLVYMYSLALNFYLWDKASYRTPGTFRDDLRKNLRNVAIPGTGVPLSLFCFNKITLSIFLFVVYPLISLLSALFVWIHAKMNGSYGEYFRTQMLEPEDWFSFWQMNCRLASYHAFITGSDHYKYENKWEFIREGSKLEPPVAVSPFISTLDTLVIKDKNEEGGMGVYMFRNAAQGGDWIIQAKLNNAAFLRDILPDPCPLSTFRVMTSSTGGLSEDGGDGTVIEVLSCVFRAGRKGAITDHSSVLFDIDIQTRCFKEGTTNNHWYSLGVRGLMDWRKGIHYIVSSKDICFHPDVNRRIKDKMIPKDIFDDMISICKDAHFRMMKDVPIVGWDAAVTDHGIYLLEANLSSNFFRGTFERDFYFERMEAYFRNLEKLRRRKV